MGRGAYEHESDLGRPITVGTGTANDLSSASAPAPFPSKASISLRETRVNMEAEGSTAIKRDCFSTGVDEPYLSKSPEFPGAGSPNIIGTRVRLLGELITPSSMAAGA